MKLLTTQHYEADKQQKIIVKCFTCQNHTQLIDN